jgi:nitrate reductase gamma subunit
MAYFDFLLFAVFPYFAVLVAIIGGIWRYTSNQFSYSSNSSQFLGESRTLSLGAPLFHFSMITILLAHFLAMILPNQWKILLEDDRLYFFESLGWVLAITALIGLALLIGRRLGNSRLLATTSIMDWVLLAALIFQIGLGFWVAFFFSWGSEWYNVSVVPWLQSLVRLDPEISHVIGLSWEIKAHLIGGFLLLALFPYTRLVHIVTVPLSYLWRPYHIMVWNRKTPPENPVQEAKTKQTTWK